ncbi:MAG: DUF4332 domain-containing protein [Pseudomonadota bacterium]
MMGMTYLIGEIAVLLAAAGVIGFIVGWGFRHMSSGNSSAREEELAIQVRRLETDRDELENRLRRAQEMVRQVGGDASVAVTIPDTVAPVDTDAFNRASEKSREATSLPGVQIAQGLRKSAAGSGEYRVADLIGLDEHTLQQMRELGIRTTHDLLRETDSESKLRLMATAIEQDVSQVRRWRSLSDLLRVPGMDMNHAQLLIGVGVLSVDTLNEHDAPELQAKLVAANDEHGLVAEVAAIANIETWVEYASPLSQLDLDG